MRSYGRSAGWLCPLQAKVPLSSRRLRLIHPTLLTGPLRLAGGITSAAGAAAALAPGAQVGLTVQPAMGKLVPL